MGKKAKEHRKKVKARNEKLMAEKKKMINEFRNKFYSQQNLETIELDESDLKNETEAEISDELDISSV